MIGNKMEIGSLIRHQGIISPPGRDLNLSLMGLPAVPVSFFKSISIISGGGGLIFEGQ
jgi:hypothetical protein